jgi:hypothetical protein
MRLKWPFEFGMLSPPLALVADFYSLMGKVDWPPILKAFIAYELLM